MMATHEALARAAGTCSRLLRPTPERVWSHQLAAIGQPDRTSTGVFSGTAALATGHQPAERA